MPDSADYETFFELIAHPERWSEDDRRLIERQLGEQQQMLDAANPRDRRTLTRLTEVVALIEAARADAEQSAVHGDEVDPDHQ